MYVVEMIYIKFRPTLCDVQEQVIPFSERFSTINTNTGTGDTILQIQGQAKLLSGTFSTINTQIPGQEILFYKYRDR
jgi:hypothetical protein